MTCANCLSLFSSFEEKSREIIVTGAVRGRMCEHLGRALGLPNPERLFLIGLLSVLEGILERPMQQIVSSLPLSPEIADASIRFAYSVTRHARVKSERSLTSFPS